MIASMFNLEHRLNELRPTEAELRIARELRKAAAPAHRPTRSVGEPTRTWTGNAAIGSHLSRLVAF
jgi:hypothetical protein